MNALKEKLLDLEVFIDNSYLSKYCELILSNIDTQKEKYKTQRHHIIPKSYYKQNNLIIDNTTENLVNLKYKDHILAHYYLSLCTRDRFKYDNILALRRMISSKTFGDDEKSFLNNLEKYQELYEFSRIFVGKMDTNRSHPASDYVKLRASQTHKGKIISEEQKAKRALTMRNKSEKEKELITQHRRESHLGKKLSENHKMKISQKLKGRKNSPEVRSLISKRMLGNKISVGNTVARGRIWINNGINCKMIYPEQLNDFLILGYVQGRIINKNKKK